MSDSFRPLYYMEPEDLRPTAADWFRHGVLFFLTFLTTLLAGLTVPFGPINAAAAIPEPSSALEWIFIVPFILTHFLAGVFQALAEYPFLIFDGLKFSLSLLTILTFHEFGHYIACRLYGVKSSLPFFIPLPILSPAGTLGAVIRIQSPLPTQKAIFDVGVAGPLAGFAVIVPLAIIGLATMQYAPVDNVPAGEGLVFADPLLMRFFGALMNVDPTRGTLNSFYAAAWVGALITSLNLLPVSQLDGGHAVYAALGERIHYWVGRAGFVGMVIITIVGYELYGTPSTLIFTILLAILLRVPHPEPFINDPLDTKRKLIGIFTILVFALCFMPFPIHSN